MGFWNWFGSRPAKRTAQRPPTLREPRPQHYEFAHRVFPVFAFRKPEVVIDQLASDAAPQFLASMWRIVGRDLARRGLPTEDARFSAPVRRSLDAGILWLIECPPTAGPREAAWIGILYRSRPTRGRIAYFTLEVGTRVADDDPPYHVVCEWLPNGCFASPREWTHWNSCIESDPDPDALAVAIAKALAIPMDRRAGVR